MHQQFELFKGTFHETNVGEHAQAIPNLPEDIPPLRAEVTRRNIGKVATTQGEIDVVGLEFGGLDEESMESLNRIKSVSRKLGETATPLVVTSIFASIAVAISDRDRNSPVKFGWPAKLERDADGRIRYANQIATLPEFTSQDRPILSQQALAHFRQKYLIDDKSTKRPIKNLSPDQLMINGQPLEQDKPLEPSYPSEVVGAAQSENVAVVSQQRGEFPPNSRISSDYLNVVHSNTLLAIQLANDLPFGYFEASNTVMANVGRNPETGQQTNEISEFAVFGQETIENYRKLI